MKRKMMVALSVAAMLGLSACGQSDHAKLVKSCMADGNDKKTCTCMADKLEASLSEDIFAAVAASSAEEGDDDLAALKDLAPMDQMKVGVNMMEAAVSCGLQDE